MEIDTANISTAGSGRERGLAKNFADKFAVKQFKVLLTDRRRVFKMDGRRIHFLKVLLIGLHIYVIRYFNLYFLSHKCRKRRWLVYPPPLPPGVVPKPYGPPRPGTWTDLPFLVPLLPFRTASVV
jgi:hypothetical protein